MSLNSSQKIINVYAQGFIYILGGLIHIISPDIYYPLIPSYFIESSDFLKGGLGTLEAIFGLQLFFSRTRARATIGILFILLISMPSQIYFIISGGCMNKGLCIPTWLLWVRLILIHPILIYWAFNIYRLSMKLSVK